MRLWIACVRGPDQVTARYGVPATQLRWYQTDHEPVPLVKCVKVPMGMIIDAFRTASWVRRHDVVIVPGMGVLEATVPLRPWHTPYSMFLLCASGRLFKTKVALVCVGADRHSSAAYPTADHRGCTARILPILPGHLLQRCDAANGSRYLG